MSRAPRAGQALFETCAVPIENPAVNLDAPLSLHPLHGGVCQVLMPNGELVGNLKLIGGCWKFKAVGHGPQGEVVPGGGPFTHKHNMVFERLDALEVSARLRDWAGKL